MMEATATIAMIPMTTPKTVNSDLVLCWRRESNAMRVLSLISIRTVETSLTIQTSKFRSAGPRWDPVGQPGVRGTTQRTIPRWSIPQRQNHRADGYLGG